MAGFSDTLLGLRSTAPGRKHLLSIDSETMAHHLCLEDPYQENARMRSALRHAGISDENSALPAWYEHALNCAIREAAFLEGSHRYHAPEIEIHGKDWWDETNGHPTLLIAAMTQALPDALAIVQQLDKTRPIVIYGESMSVEAFGPLAGYSAGDGLSAVRRIHGTLMKHGVLCTYPDFVYHGHPSIEVTLFGQPRAMASGFASLAGHHGTMLLPVHIQSSNKGRCLRVEFEEPTQIPRMNESTLSEERSSLAQLVADMLAGIIQRDVTQWLLLPTLTFDSPQMSAPASKPQ